MFTARVRPKMTAALRYLGANPILAVFIGIALAVRLVFWFYTGRVWEDALITITAARNVWEGVGLTHHVSEPRVHSFTSPISVLIPIVGEAFNSGLLLLRLSSLAASVATIYCAYRIGLLLQFHWAAHVLVLTYLACDQLQIFFGMAGMETQVVTAVAIASCYYFLARKWWALGLMCGFATIARPEFIMFILPPIGIALLVFHWREVPKVALPALAIAVPWYAFATLYYGSPVPNTIVAKSLSYRYGFLSAPLDRMWSYTVESWRDYAPFKEFWVSFPQYDAPLPTPVLMVIVATVALLFLTGLIYSVRRKPALLVAGAAVLGFLAYRNSTILNSYYMWYLPPFLALGFVIAGFGLTQLALRQRTAGVALGTVLAFAYAMHLPFSMPLDRKVQQKIETGVREKTGRKLAAMMQPTDTVVLEPLGFLGWAVFNRTVFDYPGLGSKVSVRAVKDMVVPNVAGLVHALQPTHAVLRPNEYDDLSQQYPDTADKYEVASHVRAKPDLRLRKWGYEYGVIDNDFRILRRTRDFEQVVRP